MILPKIPGLLPPAVFHDQDLLFLFLKVFLHHVKSTTTKSSVFVPEKRPVSVSANFSLIQPFSDNGGDCLDFTVTEMLPNGTHHVSLKGERVP